MGLISAIKKAVGKGRAKDQERKDERLALGGSKLKEREILGEAHSDMFNQKAFRPGDQKNMRQLVADTDLSRDKRQKEYESDRRQFSNSLDDQRASIGGIGAGAANAAGILGRAAGTNRLTNTAEGILSKGQAGTEGALGQRSSGVENVLAQRASAMGAAPSYAQLANQAIAAQTQGVQDQTNFAQGQLARRAMGMAAGSGEGGALNAQQAMTSLVGGGADMAVQANLANQQNAAAMRAQAAMAQRGETVGEAANASQARLEDVGTGAQARLNNVASGQQARLGAAGTERASDLATANKQADLSYGSGIATNQAQGNVTNAAQGALGVGAQSNSAAGTLATQAGLGNLGQTNAAIGQEESNYSGLLTSKMNSGEKLEATQPRAAWKQAFMPFGILGN